MSRDAGTCAVRAASSRDTRHSVLLLAAGGEVGEGGGRRGYSN